jgi:hypothetical protein
MATLMAKTQPVLIRLDPILHEGLTTLARAHGESAGVIVRGLLRTELVKQGIFKIRAIEDSYDRIEAARPLGRLEK